MAKMYFADKLSIKLEVLEHAVSARIALEGKLSNETAAMVASGYIKSFMIEIITERLGQKETLARVEERIMMQLEKINTAKTAVQSV